jgi:hypothetical protein
MFGVTVLIRLFDFVLAPPDITFRLLAQGEDYGRPRIINGVVLFADVRGIYRDKS